MKSCAINPNSTNTITASIPTDSLYYTTSTSTTGTSYPATATGTGTGTFSDCLFSTTSKNLTFTIKDLEEFKKITIKDSEEFKKIIQIVPNKVYKFIFNDDTEIKTVCDKEDEEFFDLEYAFFLALAKKKFSKTHTLSGVMRMANELKDSKRYDKIVKKGLKLFKKQQKEKIKEKEEENRKKEQHKKYIQKKKDRDHRQAEKAKENLYNIIRAAIEDAKNKEG